MSHAAKTTALSSDPTLHEALATAGYGSRGADEALTRSPKMFAREVYRLADGAVIDHMRAHEAWEWLHAGCPEVA